MDDDDGDDDGEDAVHHDCPTNRADLPYQRQVDQDESFHLSWV
jgi:hypothetical protein